MAGIKEKLISRMQNGQNILDEIEIARKNGFDMRKIKNHVDGIVSKYHPGMMQFKVVGIVDETSEAKSIRLEIQNLKQLPIFQAGQFINIFVNIDGIITSRPYSLSSPPTNDKYFEITVAKAKNGFVADYLLANAKVGDIFFANGPAGNLVYNPVFHSKTSVFLAGGSGVTPFVSMAREIRDKKKKDRQIYMIYGARREEVAIFNKELESIAKECSNFHYELIISDDVKTKYKKGFIDSKLIKSIVPNYKEATYYMCGPQVMTDFCMGELEKLEIKKKDIRREVFGSVQDIKSEPGYPNTLTGNEVYKIKVGNKVINARANESIIQSLEREHLNVKVCCRSGGCSLCRVKLIKGDVFMPRGVSLRYADAKFNYIHTCKTYPLSDLEIQI